MWDKEVVLHRNYFFSGRDWNRDLTCGTERHSYSKRVWQKSSIVEGFSNNHFRCIADRIGTVGTQSSGNFPQTCWEDNCVVVKYLFCKHEDPFRSPARVWDSCFWACMPVSSVLGSQRHQHPWSLLGCCSCQIGEFQVQCKRLCLER